MLVGEGLKGRLRVYMSVYSYRSRYRYRKRYCGGELTGGLHGCALLSPTRISIHPSMHACIPNSEYAKVHSRECLWFPQGSRSEFGIYVQMFEAFRGLGFGVWGCGLLPGGVCTAQLPKRRCTKVQTMRLLSKELELIY